MQRFSANGDTEYRRKRKSLKKTVFSQFRMNAARIAACYVEAFGRIADTTYTLLLADRSFWTRAKVILKLGLDPKSFSNLSCLKVWSMSDLASRPLSPHLSVYRFTWLMTASIIHRITGAALYFGTLILLAGLIALSIGPEAYQSFLECAHSLIGRLILFGYTWALMHHALGGVRHLIWDTGRAFSVPIARGLAILNFLLSAALAVSIWIYAGALS